MKQGFLILLLWVWVGPLLAQPAAGEMHCLPQDTFVGVLSQSTVPRSAISDVASAPPVSYADAYRRASAENKPLVVWVGAGICPACIHSTEGEFVHHTTLSFPDVPSSGGIVVGVPDGRGGVDRVATITQWITSDPTWGHVPSLRRALAAWREHRVTMLSGWSMGVQRFSTSQGVAPSAFTPSFRGGFRSRGGC